MSDFKRIIQRTTNSLRIETGVAELEPNEICIVEDTEEMIYKNRDGMVVSISKDKYTVDTIECLKKSKKYKYGDIVNISGYLTKGDGGNHKRKKMPHGYNGSDKIIGYDNSIWGIVSNNSVDVRWFGATGDGISDDTQPLQNAINFSNIVHVNLDNLVLSETLILNENVMLNLKTKIIFKGTNNVFELKAGAIINGNNSIIEIINSNWDATVIYINGKNNFYHHGTNFNNIIMKNLLRKGTAVFFDCSKESTFITFVYSNNITIDGFNFGLTLACSKNEANSQWSWINSNTFENYSIRLCNNPINMNGTPGIGGEMANNKMLEFKLEVDTTSVLAGHQNIFEIFIWDWDYSRPNKPITFYPGSLNNELTTNIAYEGIEGVDNNNCFIYHRNGVNYDTSDRIFSRRKRFRDGLKTNLIEPNNGQLIIKQTDNGTGYINILDGLFVNGPINPWVTNGLDLGEENYRFNKAYINEIISNTVASLDTPYYVEKMREAGVYQAFLVYMDKLTVYNSTKRELDKKMYQEFLRINLEFPDLTYNEWKSKQPSILLIDKPEPSEELLEFKIKYKG